MAYLLSISDKLRRRGTRLPLHSTAAGHVLAHRRFATAAIPAYLALVAGGVALVGTAILEQSLLATLTIAGVLGLLGVLLATLEGTDSAEQTRMRWWFLTAFGFRIFVAVVLHQVLVVAYGSDQTFWQQPSGGDERAFFYFSQRYVYAWQDGTIASIQPYWYERPIHGWLHVVGMVRYVGVLLGGDTVFNVKLVCSWSGALLIVYTYKIALYLFNARIARLAAILSFWLPDYIYLASTLWRDIFVALVIAFIFCQLVTFVFAERRIWRIGAMLLVLVMVVPHLRGQLAPLIGGIIGILVLLKFILSHHLRSRLLGGGIALLLLVSILGTLGSTVMTSSLQQRANAYVDAAIGNADDDSFGRIIQQLPPFVRAPVAGIQLLLLPLPPWGPLQARGLEPRGVVEAIAGMVWFFGVVPLFIPGAIAAYRQNRIGAVWVGLPALVLLLLLALSGGLLIRWRLMLMPFLMIIAAHGMVYRRDYPFINRVTAEAQLALIAVYMMLKYLL